ncbi:hypothetical protein BT96DRAFT_936682 [Gymnopus androsaceus JB14]|uniref:WD40 repeat-like protein n=1 Tax=Gymnopus androsaceus JB14 TaxID=1447944 RepID=A0A6A4HZL5_9AGAR|nr:hypothetical protein BT96DRAFT_936682 [Gymnopus androsaceus JB14]
MHQFCLILPIFRYFWHFIATLQANLDIKSNDFFDVKLVTAIFEAALSNGGPSLSVVLSIDTAQAIFYNQPEPLKVKDHRRDAVLSTAFSPDGKYVVSGFGCDPGIIKVRDFVGIVQYRKDKRLWHLDSPHLYIILEQFLRTTLEGEKREDQ